MIRFEDVIIEIGEFRLAANMAVPKGFTSVIGQSGAGKSTLLSALSGHRPLTSGKIFVDETRIDLLPPNKRPCSIIFQEFNSRLTNVFKGSGIDFCGTKEHIFIFSTL